MDATESSVIERPKHRNQYPPAVTKAKQRMFLEVLRTTGMYGNACKSADIDPSGPHQWAHKNSNFAKAFESARAQGEKVLLDQYETSLDTTVLENDEFEQVCKSQILRMFRMKRLDPRYRDNAVTNVNVIGPAAIQFNLTPIESMSCNGSVSPHEGDTK